MMSTPWSQVLVKINALEERFNSQSLREKILIAGSVFALIFLVWTYVFYPGLEASKEQLDTRLLDAEKNMTAVLGQEKVFAKALVNDPNATIKYEILQLEAKLKQLDEDLQSLSVGLIPASNFASVIEDVLSANNTLTLLGMTTLKPVRLNFGPSRVGDSANKDNEIIEQDKSEEQKAWDALRNPSINESLNTSDPTALEPTSSQNQVGVFKHAIRVNISGRYFDVVNYLDALEDLSWTFYWSYIDYQVDTKNSSSPIANVVFEIYTLSTDAGVFGV